MNPKLMKAYFNFENITYNLRNGTSLSLLPARSTKQVQCRIDFHYH